MTLLLVFFAGCGRQSEPKDTSNSADGATAAGNESSSKPESTRIRFEDIAADVGLQFTAATGQESGYFTILESLGSGIAFCDYDGDSRPDLAIPGGGRFDEQSLPIGQPFGLFRQNAFGRMTSASLSAGIPEPEFYTHGINVGDWDNDGFSDFVITGFHGIMILHNQGDGTFTRVTWDLPAPWDRWSTSSAFLDLENDGDLDLYIVNYVDLKPGEYRKCIVKGHRDVCPPGEYDAVSDQLLLNNGDGTFADVSDQVGLVPGGKGLAVISGDVDHDGDCDLYVANDTTANLLYINDGQGHLEEQGLISGSALGATTEAEGSMGVEFADFNQDGRTDIWVSNYENQSFAMYECRGSGFYQHVSAVKGITAVGQLFVGFGTAALDADLDGDPDLFAVNGHVMYHSTSAPRKQTPLIFENDGGKYFRNVAPFAGSYSAHQHEGRGLATGDFDGDGRPDVAISNCNEPVALLRNISVPRDNVTNGNWFGVRLIGGGANRDAVGAVIRIRRETGVQGADSADHAVELHTSGGSYLSSKDSVHLFAESADSPERSKSVEVSWPGGHRTVHPIERGHVTFCIDFIASPSTVD